jgi:hypothetical protein
MNSESTTGTTVRYKEDRTWANEKERMRIGEAGGEKYDRSSERAVTGK